VTPAETTAASYLGSREHRDISMLAGFGKDTIGSEVLADLSQSFPRMDQSMFVGSRM
jgi:hypothetical protein